MAGRPNRQRLLDVWMNSQRVGRWSVDARGVHAFGYDAAWPASPHARALSLSLPLGVAKPLRGERVRAYFDNLLPTAALPRQRLQSSCGAASADTFDLLAAAGGDCAGATQLLPPGAEPGEAFEHGALGGVRRRWNLERHDLAPAPRDEVCERAARVHADGGRSRRGRLAHVASRPRRRRRSMITPSAIATVAAIRTQAGGLNFRPTITSAK